MQSELQLQAQCFQWLWNTYPETRLLCWHVTNEMKPNAVQTGTKNGGKPDYALESTSSFRRRIAQAKAAGLVPGVWDLHFLWKGTLHLIELKVGNNRLSNEQMAFARKTEDHGAVAHKPCYDISDFRELIMHIFNT